MQEPTYHPRNPSSKAPANRIPLYFFWLMCAKMWGRIPPLPPVLADSEVELSNAFLEQLCRVYFAEEQVQHPQPEAEIPTVGGEEKSVPGYISVSTLLDTGLEPVTPISKAAFPSKKKT